MSDSLSACPTAVLTSSFPAQRGGDPALPASAGRYQLLGEIARGGMGVVVRARDPKLGRDLAVKLLLPEHRDQQDLVLRFLAEARVMARLRHPGVPAVHEVGLLADGRPFIAMKLVEGRTLTELLGGLAAAPDELPRFLAVFEQVCQTVACAHAQGFAHCDLKPANLMVGAFGEVQVMDWGLASGGEIDGPDGVQGTPAYMAPEQARGEKVGPAADVFALGAMLCEILTGRPPYLGERTTRVFMDAATAKLDKARRRLEASGADADLIQLAMACLAPRPEDRPADGAAVADALARYTTRVRERLRAAELKQARAAADRRARRWRAGLAASLLVSGLSAAVGALGFWRERQVTAASIEADLAEAIRLRDQNHWAEARAAVGRAEGRLDRFASDDLRGRARQVRADLEMVALLEEAAVEETQVRDGKFDSEGADAAYAAAFRDYGIDFEVLPPEAAARRIRESAVHDPLVAGLDHWCVAADPNSANRDRLFAAANLADPDPWRVQFRDAIRGRDRAEVGRLVESAGAASVPRETAILLSQTPFVPARSAEISALRIVQQRFPDEFSINDHMGQALRVTRPPQTEEAVGFLRTAAALRPESPGARLNLGGALLDLDRGEEAEACFREALRLKPDYAEALYCLGEALDRQSRFPEAREVLEECIRRNPDRSDMHNGLGNVLLHCGEREADLAQYREAVRLDPHNGGAHANLARSLHDRGDRDGAMAEYRLAIGSDPDQALPHYNLGTLLLNETERPEEAAAEFREAIRCKPDYAEAYCNLGHAHVRQGQFADGLASLRRGDALGMKEGDAWRYPSAEWVRNAERLILLDGRFDALLAGGPPPGPAPERLELAHFCQEHKERYAWLPICTPLLSPPRRTWGTIRAPAGVTAPPAPPPAPPRDKVGAPPPMKE